MQREGCDKSSLGDRGTLLPVSGKQLVWSLPWVLPLCSSVKCEVGLAGVSLACLCIFMDAEQIQCGNILGGQKGKIV